MAEVEQIVSSTSWEGLHFTCTPDQAMWLFLAMKDARDAVAKRNHSCSMGTLTPHDMMLETADQWDFYDRMAKRAVEYATANTASVSGLRYPDGRPFRIG